VDGGDTRVTWSVEQDRAGPLYQYSLTELISILIFEGEGKPGL
jgi:hypothetical protein